MDGLALLAAAAPIIPIPPPHVPLVYAPSHGRLSEEQRWSIIAYYKDNKTNLWIADKLNIGRNTVSRVFKRYNATGKVSSGSRSGRPKCTQQETDENIIIAARIIKYTSPKKLITELNLDVSPSTVKRILNKG